MRVYDHFIDGQWVAPDSGAYLESDDPYKRAPWAQIARGNGADAARAIESAENAFRAGSWHEMDTAARAATLDKLADHLEACWPDLVEAEVRDNGKRIVEVRGQFSALHSWYRHFADRARKISAERHENGAAGVTSETRFIPFGVVVAITPWNSPLMILAWKLAPALAAGNTAVVKPSELASASTLEFAYQAHAAGLPPGVLNVVTGLGHEVGEALVRHRLTRKVSFTGSELGGSKVAEAAAGRVVPATLELGGKSPQVVFADADIESAVNGVLSGIFLSNGQTCVAGSRLIVEASIQDAFVARLVERAKRLRMGDPMDPETEVAPLANARHYEKVVSAISAAKDDGVVCLLDGRQTAAGQTGLFVGPTIFLDVSTDKHIWREEVFGPVLAVREFSTEAEAISLANDTEFGLAGGVWTTDQEKAERVADAIQAGTVYINHYRSVVPGAPVGGVKKSGYGRELGPDAVKDYLQVKAVWRGTTPVANPFPSTQ